jgi:hypothetical protein
MMQVEEACSTSPTTAAPPGASRPSQKVLQLPPDRPHRRYLHQPHKLSPLPPRGAPSQGLQEDAIARVSAGSSPPPPAPPPHVQRPILVAVINPREGDVVLEVSKECQTEAD